MYLNLYKIPDGYLHGVSHNKWHTMYMKPVPVKLQIPTCINPSTESLMMLAILINQQPSCLPETWCVTALKEHYKKTNWNLIQWQGCVSRKGGNNNLYVQTLFKATDLTIVSPNEKRVQIIAANKLK